MKRQLTYIELKTGYSDNGPAWIGLVEFSKTGQTLYFDNKALKKQKIPGSNSNHYDIETGDEYWVSGIKKNGQDRLVENHPYGERRKCYHLRLQHGCRDQPGKKTDGCRAY